MNKEKIFEMIKPCLVDNQLTWDELDTIFYMLSEKEKYLTADLLIDELKRRRKIFSSSIMFWRLLHRILRICS